MAEVVEPKTKDDIKQLLKHLEDEHRKANISDTTYKELKEKYKGQMSYMDNSVADEGSPPMEEETPEQAAARMAAAPPPTETAEGGDGEEKKGGFLGKIKLPGLGKKAAPAPVAAAAPPPPQASGDSMAMIEIEKIKTMMDAVRDQKKSTDESIQSIFESIGEVRSMAIQSDANDREINSKLERITDDVTTLRPKDIEKRFTQISESLEKYQLTLEKMQAKTDDMAVNLNKLMENFKVIGNMENLANINTNVQNKLADIQEATNYTERLASKAEKLYIDLKMELEDIVIYKSKQEGLDEAMRDVLKTIDAMNTKFENYTTKKDIENERQDIMILGKETESLKNALALVQTNVPEPILNLRKEREDVNIFLDSLEEQYKTRVINAADYEMMKKNNLDKLKTLNMALEKEWKNYEKLVEKAKSLPPPPPVEEPTEAAAPEEEESLVPQPPTPEEVKEEEKTEEVQEAKEDEKEMLQEDKQEASNPMVEEIKKEVMAPEKPEGKILPRGSDEEMMKDIKQQLENEDAKPEDPEHAPAAPLPPQAAATAPETKPAAKEAPKKKEKKKFLNLPF